MKRDIVSALLLLGLSVSNPSNSINAMSLAEMTGEHVSLWDALAKRDGIDPVSWTRSQYKEAVRFYATKVGIFYDGSYEGNLAILNAEMPTTHKVEYDMESSVLSASDEPSRYEVDTHRTLFQMQRAPYSAMTQLNPTLTYNILEWNQTTQTHIQEKLKTNLRIYEEKSIE